MDLKKIREELKKSSSPYKIIADFTYDWEYWISPDHSEFVYVSPSCKRITGYSAEEFIQNAGLFFEIIDPSYLDFVRKELNTPDCPWIFDYKIRTKDGLEKWVSHTFQNIYDTNGNYLGRRGSIRDITERKNIELKLRQSEEDLKDKTGELEELNRDLENSIQSEINRRRAKERMLIQQSKLASLGEMMGAIAHQWRQPLSTLSILVQGVAHRRRLNKLDDEYLNSFESESVRLMEFMSSTIDNFQNFFRKNKEKEFFDVCKAIENTISILSAQLESSFIKVRTEFPEKGCFVFGYRNEFMHVVMNIISNARNAILEKKPEEGFPGVIDVTVSVKEDFMLINFQDNGGGIDKNILDRIFEPFFTTGFYKKGTGIGLYMSKMIIEKDFSGTIDAVNNGNGALFRIKLKEMRNELKT